jgi:hypothetical protein
VLRAVGPYLLMEILLPGGTLLAISLWLYRRYAVRKSAARVSRAAAFATALLIALEMGSVGFSLTGTDYLLVAEARRGRPCAMPLLEKKFVRRVDLGSAGSSLEGTPCV